MAVIRVAVVGRPNVGKSTLFNRLLGRRRAIVHDMPGVTRDRIEERAEWYVGGHKYAIQLIDTGGLGHALFESEIEEQVNIALSESDAVLFLCDSQEGYTQMDAAVLKGLRQGGVLASLPIAVIANKVDEPVHEERVNDFYEAGIDPVIAVSAEHNRGIQTIKEWVISVVVKESKEQDETEAFEETEIDAEAESEIESKTDTEEQLEVEPKSLEELPLDEIPVGEVDPSKPICIAVVGRPNVGKSTFVNALLGRQRMITSSIAGTTSDSIDSQLDWQGRPYLLIDTAGVRRKSKTEKGIEVLSVVQTKKTLDRADIALLVLDGGEGVSDQDEKIGGLIEDAGTSVVIMVNKWDLQGQTGFKREEGAQHIREQMKFLKYAPIMFISAKNQKGYDNLKDLIDDIIEQKRLKVTTREFSDWVRKESEIHNPFGAKFYLSHQAGKYPPTFVSHVNDPKKVDFSLRRHLVNAIREKWGFMGSPIRMIFRRAEHSKPTTR